MECQHCSHTDEICIEKVPIFSHLSREEMMEIAMVTTHKDFQKGEIIYMAGERTESLFVINKGLVKVYKISDAGKEQIIRILGPGDFIDQLSLFTNSPSKSNAEAIEETSMCMINGENIKDIIEKRPTIALKLMKELGKRLEQTEDLIESLGLQNVEQRIAGMLLELAQNTNIIHLSISKRDLASYIGMSQETLSRKLTSFQNMEWIEQKGQRKIIIKNRQALKNICEM